MNLPEAVIEWIADFERNNGHKPHNVSIAIAAYSYQLGEKLADRGHRDAQSGCSPLSFSTFESAARTFITGESRAAIGCANEIAVLLHDNYMAGYSSRKEDV